MWGEEAAGDERPWLRGRLRANGCGELRGRLRTAWVQGVARNGVDEEAAGDEQPWLRGRLTANGYAEPRGVDGCGRRGCNGVAGNGWGEEAAVDERPWLRGRLTANGCGELCRRLRTAWVQVGGWNWVGRRSR